MANRQDYSSGSTPVAVGAPSVGTPSLDPNNLPKVPFRIATLERNDLIQVDTQVMTTVEQLIERVLPGTGLVYDVDLDYVATAPSNNSANVAYNEDAPYNALSSGIFRDVNAEVIDVDGYSLKLAGRYGGWERFNEESSTDTLIWNKVTGTGATGGNFRFHTKMPIALNRRTLLGLLGNQDRGQSYLVRANLAGSGTIYSTAPTVQPNVTINRHYGSYALPNPVNDQGQPQQILPPFFGVIPYITRSVNPNAPTGGQTTTHFLQRINTTFRALILVFRSNGSRATAESNLPTNVQLRVGNQSIFNELPAVRRRIMYDRTGFDAPAGVIVYDMEHDFDGLLGAELGNDWYWTQQLSEMQFNITYPSGFGSSNNSLTIITLDMTIPTGMNLYAA